MKAQPFDIIPVLDVRDGVAVRAVAGNRAQYRPLVTPLAASADPVAVALGYRDLYPFKTLYIADLDAIEGRGGNRDLAVAIRAGWPGLGLWVDEGASDAARIASVLETDGTTAVVGSETGVTAIRMQDLCERFGSRIVLSLDFASGAFAGDGALLADASCWPQRVIAMTLARVGTRTGPDLACVSDIVARAGAGRQVYAAGGVRDVADLKALRCAGAAGALVASALHGGQIKTGGLDEATGS